MLPKALVDAEPETEVATGLSADVERVWVWEAERIAVGGLNR